MTVLAAIAAIFSNLKNIEDIFVNNFSKPALELTLVGDQPVNVIGGRKTAIEVACRNLGWCPVSVRILPVTADNGNAADLFDNSEQGLPTIAVGGSSSFQIRLVPMAGLNSLTCTGFGSAGIYRELPIGRLIIPVTVWNPVDTPLTARVAYTFKNISDVLVVAVTARHGDPPKSGVRYEAILNPSEDVYFFATEDQPLDQPPEVNGGTAIAIWHDNELAPFTLATYSLTLRAKIPKNQNEWSTIANRIKVFAEPIRRSGGSQ